MVLHIFCVRDRATEAYGTPMFLQSAGQATRSFSDEVNREAPDNQLYAHPDDFDLYVCGSWDSSTGEFDTVAPAIVCRGKDVSVTYRESN